MAQNIFYKGRKSVDITPNAAEVKLKSIHIKTHLLIRFIVAYGMVAHVYEIIQ